VAMIALFAGGLANMAAASRLMFSLSRDNMLPGSRRLAQVSETTRSPIGSLLTVTAISVALVTVGTYIATEAMTLTMGMASVNRRGGTVVLFGGLPRGDVPLDPYRIHDHELTLRGSYHHTPAAIRQALALLGGGAHPFAERLTHTYPLERVAEPLAQAAGLTAPDDRLLKAIIRP